VRGGGREEWRVRVVWSQESEEEKEMGGGSESRLRSLLFLATKQRAGGRRVIGEAMELVDK
jgi:hypothetical protein